MRNQRTSFTAEDQEQLMELWGKLPDPMPSGVFNVVSPRFTSVAIETVVLRSREGILEVLLAQRTPDEVYPGQWHSLGTLLRRSDVASPKEEPGTYVKAFERLQRDKFRARFTHPPVFAGSIPFNSPRGLIVCLVHRCSIDGEPPVGQYFPVDQIPEPIVASHPHIINMAVRSFREHAQLHSE